MLREKWLEEEAAAHIKGWDFSHIEGRYEEEGDLPWNYEAVVRKYMQPKHRLLDIDTGGGEFLRALGHPFENTAATEGYPPNIELCKSVLLPLGIDFRQADDPCKLPFEQSDFDIVINRHGDFNAHELYRIIKPKGIFVTEQVGALNDRELVDMLLPGTPIPFEQLRLSKVVTQFKREGFEILEAQEAFRPIKFFDVGALVWFARIIEWEFPGFSVEKCFEKLCDAQRLLEKNGKLEGNIHRILLVAKKV